MASSSANPVAPATTAAGTTKIRSGSSSVVGGVGEVTGMQYSPISTMERQYDVPLGQRLLLFVRTNANCCLQGGVETILKLQKTKQVAKMAASSAQPVGSEAFQYNNHHGEGCGNNTAPSIGQSDDDPFAFLSGGGDDGQEGCDSGYNSSGSANGNSQQRTKGPNIGRFLKKVAKNTTTSFERSMQELAIRADQGRTPDLLTACLFFQGELLAMTDSVPLPKVTTGVSFNIPLWIPPRLDDASQVTLKLFIHSQASWITSTTGKGKSKHYVIGHSQLHVGQMRQLLLRQRKGFFSLTLASSLVADGRIQLCVLPDLKLPALGQRGWSLTDPRYSGFASALFNPPLDQSYCLNSVNARNQWLIATERAGESTIVLPLAAAFARLCTQACDVSVKHAEAVSAHLLSKRTEQKEPGNCAHVQVHLHYLQLDDTTFSGQLQNLSMTMAWQPPDSIFELELLPSVTIPTRGHGEQVSDSAPEHSLQFFPPVCSKEILPAILKAYGGQLPPVGYLLGNLRLQFLLPVHKQQVREIWETIIVLEQHVGNIQDYKSPRLMQFPVYSASSGHKVGSIVIALSVELESQTIPLPSAVSPRNGLPTLVGLEALVEGTIPFLDFDVPSNQQLEPQQEEDARRRKNQLATMGNFVSHAYLEQHIQSKRKADFQCFQEKAYHYQRALQRNDEKSFPAESVWQDMSPRPFRPSSSRSEILLSGLPFNTHNVSFCLDIIVPNDNRPQSDGALFHNVTCGAPADHASGFGNIFLDKAFTSPVGSVAGGLRRLEQTRYELAKKVQEVQSYLVSGVASYFQAARQQQKYLNHVPARHASIQDLRWKVFEAVHAYHHVTWICTIRRASAFSQALGIAVTSYLTSLSDIAKCQIGWPELWARHGYLVSFEGLLSAAGKELGMIEDAAVAIDMLRMVRIVLVPDDGNGSHNTNVNTGWVGVPHSPLLKWVNLIPSPSEGQMQYLLQIGIHAHYFEQHIPHCLRNGTTVRLFPLLFQVGVDIRQWGAHAGSNMKNQFTSGDAKDPTAAVSGGLLDDEDDDVGVADDDVLVALNFEALRKMNAYAHKISPIKGISEKTPTDGLLHWRPPRPEQEISQQQLNKMSVHPSLVMLHSHILTSAGKMNHSILDEAATLAQQLGGGGVVFCKSGKDRTAMHITYKQAQFANRFRQQNCSAEEFVDTTVQDATKMRIHGTRLPICEKNVGQALYAFNSLQSKFMPDALKPPPSTLAGFLKGGRVFGQGGIES